MRDARIRDAHDCLAAIDDYDTIIDARSPAEYALDHIPGAINLPVLDDAERAQVGLLNAEQGAFAAKRTGAALVSRNIGRLLAGPLADRPQGWRPLVYCWRGGNRSGSLATVLARVGWPTDVMAGGYRAYRREVVSDLAQWPARFSFRVVAGRTGTGKSRVLQQLAASGQQVLDLEALAEHRGSVLGPWPQRRQPSQKRFESRIWQALRTLDPQRPVYCESESRKIGQCQVPEALMLRIRASECIVIEASIDFRTRLLLDDYEHFVGDPASLVDRLEALVALHGHARIAHWSALAQGGSWSALVRELLEVHYDPAYERSMKRNFARLTQARSVRMPEGDVDAGIGFVAETIASLPVAQAPCP